MDVFLPNHEDVSILIGQRWQFLQLDMRLSTPQATNKSERIMKIARVTELHKFLWILKDS
jgi:hypothetical protein